MSEILVVDAAFIPAILPDADGFAFYLGGGNPDHVWSKADIDRARAKYNYAIPIFVRSNSISTRANGATDASQACANAREVGYTGGAIALDLETTENPVYTKAWCARAASNGYKPIAYGSVSTVQANEAPAYWAAHYGNFDIPPWAMAIQYNEGETFDRSHFRKAFADAYMYPRRKVTPVSNDFPIPTDLSATPFDTFIDMGWAAEIQYHYQVRLPGSDGVVVNATTPDLSVRAEGLKPATEYEWRVSVTPHGAWSPWQSVTTKAASS